MRDIQDNFALKNINFKPHEIIYPDFIEMLLIIRNRATTRVRDCMNTLAIGKFFWG